MRGLEISNVVMMERPQDWGDVAYEHGVNEVAMKKIPCSLMLRVKSMWCGENGKVSVVKKEKKQDTRMTSFETSTATVPRQRCQKAYWANRKIRKRTDTDVAFTREYSRVLIFCRERECTN